MECSGGMSTYDVCCCSINSAVSCHGYCYHRNNIWLVFCVLYFKHSDEDEILPMTVTNLLQIPADVHYSIRAAVLRLLSQLGGWIKEHHDMLGMVCLATDEICLSWIKLSYTFVHNSISFSMDYSLNFTIEALLWLMATSYPLNLYSCFIEDRIHIDCHNHCHHHYC